MKDRSAAEILASAQAAADRATSVVVQGTANGSTVIAKLGTGAADTTITSAGHTVEVVRIGSDNYIKGDAAFWTAQVSAAAGKTLAGKYVKIPAAQASGYAAFLSPKSFFDNTLKADGNVSKGAVTTVSGRSVVLLRDDSDGSLLAISLSGDPLPLRIQKAGKSGGVVTFTGWNQPLAVSAPAAADIIDFTSVTGG